MFYMGLCSVEKFFEQFKSKGLPTSGIPHTSYGFLFSKFFWLLENTIDDKLSDLCLGLRCSYGLQ